MRMIILAAGTGSRLAPLTNDRPKCLVELTGRPLLEWQLAAARRCGINDIVIVGGYRAEQLERYEGVQVIHNPDFASTNMVRSLFKARACFGDGFIMAYGDIVYADDVLKRLLDAPADIGVVVDEDWRRYWAQRFADPLSDAESLRRAADGRIIDIGRKVESLEEIDAQYIGLAVFRLAGVEALNAAYDAAEADDAVGASPFHGTRSLDKLYMTDLIQGLIDRGEPVQAVPIQGGWLEVDSVSDLELGERLTANGRLNGNEKQ